MFAHETPPLMSGHRDLMNDWSEVPRRRERQTNALPPKPRDLQHGIIEEEDTTDLTFLLRFPGMDGDGTCQRFNESILRDHICRGHFGAEPTQYPV